MQPSESWGPTHKNIERMQRRSSKFAARNSSARSAQSGASSSRVSAGDIALNVTGEGSKAAVESEMVSTKQTVVKIGPVESVPVNGRVPTGHHQTSPPTPPPFVSLMINGSQKTKVSPSVSAPPAFPLPAAGAAVAGPSVLKKGRRENSSVKSTSSATANTLAPTTTSAAAGGSSSSDSTLVVRNNNNNSDDNNKGSYTNPAFVQFSTNNIEDQETQI